MVITRPPCLPQLMVLIWFGLFGGGGPCTYSHLLVSLDLLPPINLTCCVMSWMLATPGNTLQTCSKPLSWKQHYSLDSPAITPGFLESQGWNLTFHRPLHSARRSLGYSPEASHIPPESKPEPIKLTFGHPHHSSGSNRPLLCVRDPCYIPLVAFCTCFLCTIKPC